MATEMTLRRLLEILIEMDGVFILQSPCGSMELHGVDFHLSHAKEWITIYHQTAPRSPESRSHLHLKWPTFQGAEIRREEGQSPHLAFFTTDVPEPVDEPMLIWYFPSFYDWDRDKAEVPENIAQYEAFVRTYGDRLQFTAPTLSG